MNTLLVGYDLNKPLQNYDNLIDKIKSFGAWWHYLDSTWLVRTSLTASEMRDQLKGLMDSNDELLVLTVSGDAWATSGLSQRANQWLRDNL